MCVTSQRFGTTPSPSCLTFFLCPSDERLHPGLEGAGPQQRGGSAERSQVRTLLNAPSSMCYTVKLEKFCLICLQVHDQTPERRDYLQADPKHAAVELSGPAEAGNLKYSGPDFKGTIVHLCAIIVFDF